MKNFTRVDLSAETHKERKRKRTQREPRPSHSKCWHFSYAFLPPFHLEDTKIWFFTFLLFHLRMFRTILVLFHSSIIIEILSATVTWCYQQNHLLYAAAELQVCRPASTALQQNFCFWSSDWRLCPALLCTTWRFNREDCFSLPRRACQ